MPLAAAVLLAMCVLWLLVTVSLQGVPGHWWELLGALLCTAAHRLPWVCVVA